MKNRSHHPPRRPRRALLACIPLVAALMGACTDKQPLIQVPDKTTSISTTDQPTAWRGYWRSPTELWVYDMTPEVGMNSSFGEADVLRRFRKAGMRLLRHTLPWKTYAQNPEAFKPALNDAAANGIEYVLVISGPRDDQMQGDNPRTATQRSIIYEQLARDMEDMVHRYPQVRFFQLFNEPDAACEPGKFFNGESAYGNSRYDTPNRYVQGRNYADMLRIVYPRMKAAARARGREVWVLTAGLTGTEVIKEKIVDRNGITHCIPHETQISWQFARGMYENGGRAYFDIAAIHAYGVTATSEASMLQRIESFNQQLYGGLNDPNRPLWLTEFGTSADWSKSLLSPTRDRTRDGAVLDQIQATWYRDALIIHRGGKQVQKILGYTYATDEGGHLPDSGISGANPWDYGLGIFRGDRVTPRPAYWELQRDSLINRAAEDMGTQTGVFRIRTSGQVPVTHLYHYEGDVMVIEGVRVNALHPTVIPMMWPQVGPDPCPPGMRNCVPL